MLVSPAAKKKKWVRRQQGGGGEEGEEFIRIHRILLRDPGGETNTSILVEKTNTSGAQTSPGKERTLLLERALSVDMGRGPWK